MAFMQREISPLQDWWDVDGTNGIEFFPVSHFTHAEALASYSGKAASIESIIGYGARLSAPGYLDCTDWSVFHTHAEAEAHLDEYDTEEDEY